VLTRRVAVVAALLLTAGCTANPPTPTSPITTPTSSTPSPTTSSSPTTTTAEPTTSVSAGPPADPTSGCHYRGLLPDPVCTPGAVNPAVTPATLADTICKAGWTATIRPPTSVSSRIKRDSEAAYGLPAGTPGELDHLISLELGGAPGDPLNLWVQPGPVPNAKDSVEGKLRAAVCAGTVSLGDAQQAIVTDWTTALSVMGLR
jgi:hypothetical protein